MSKCSVEGCEGKVFARGMCQKHYARVLAHGDPHAVRRTEFMSPDARFWRKVEKGAEDKCWKWLGATNGGPSNGIHYGGFTINGKSVRAHVYSYRTHKGEVLAGMVVMHTCDNPACVNPKHLKLGTQSENIKDSIAKGRFKQCAAGYEKDRKKGSSHHNSKLTENDVRSIRNDFRTATEAAKKFNISVANACFIRNRTAWRHVE